MIISTIISFFQISTIHLTIFKTLMIWCEFFSNFASNFFTQYRNHLFRYYNFHNAIIFWLNDWQTFMILIDKNKILIFCINSFFFNFRKSISILCVEKSFIKNTHFLLNIFFRNQFKYSSNILSIIQTNRLFRYIIRKFSTFTLWNSNVSKFITISINYDLNLCKSKILIHKIVVILILFFLIFLLIRSKKYYQTLFVKIILFHLYCIYHTTKNHNSIKFWFRCEILSKFCFNCCLFISFNSLCRTCFFV